MLRSPHARRWVTRFAPTPNWYMHLGHVLSAYFVWGVARSFKAQVILRLEDHDLSRAKREYVNAILEDLEWLGLHADTVTKQSDHFPHFYNVMTHLAKRGLVYACDCSRAAIKSRAEASYDNHCRDRGLDFKDCGLRLRMEQGEDPLIRDRNGNYTYIFANVVDDIDEDVNLIVRGDDLRPLVEKQLSIRALLTSAQRPIYFHHPLILKEDGQQKLSKSDFDRPIKSYREQGLRPEGLLGLAAHRIGYQKNPAPLGFEEWVAILHEKNLIGGIQGATHE